MLGYICKSKPDCLKDFRTSKVAYGNSFIWLLSSCVGIYKPPESHKIIKIDEELSVYPFADSINISLVSKPSIIGKPFVMGDDQKYCFPKLRICPDGTELDSRIRLTEHGEIYEVKPIHRKAWNMGESLHLHLSKQAPLSDAELYQALATVMQVNYDITVWDIRVYGLIDTNLNAILMHLLDYETWLSLESELDDGKKNSS